MKRFKEDHKNFPVLREYFKVGSDVVAGTKDKGRTSKVQFLQIISKTKLVTWDGNYFVRKPPKFFNFSTNVTKRLFSRSYMLYQKGILFLLTENYTPKCFYSI